jgi:hypothetical protein
MLSSQQMSQRIEEKANTNWATAVRESNRPIASRELAVRVVLCLLAALSLTVTTHPQQANQAGKILKWDTEPYSQSAHIVRNGVIYYIQIGKTIYKVTRRTTRPDTNLVTGQLVRCRVDKDSMFISGDRGKDQKYKILGAAAAE